MSKITITTIEDGDYTHQDYDSIGEVSDGYHTFNELYDHRIALFLALMKIYPQISWYSHYHHDGSKIDGWIIAGMHLPNGDITYHMPEKYERDYLKTIERLDRAPEWDGHTAQDVVQRLLFLAIDPCEGDE